MNKMITGKKVLTVLAHPDDEVLGAGGTIYKAAKLGSQVYVIIPATGIHSRRNKQNKSFCNSSLRQLRKDCLGALGVLGVNKQHIYLIGRGLCL